MCEFGTLRNQFFGLYLLLVCTYLFYSSLTFAGCQSTPWGWCDGSAWTKLVLLKMTWNKASKCNVTIAIEFIEKHSAPSPCVDTYSKHFTTARWEAVNRPVLASVCGTCQDQIPANDSQELELTLTGLTEIWVVHKPRSLGGCCCFRSVFLLAIAMLLKQRSFKTITNQRCIQLLNS
jgi:hypothetical protein